jgi:hypothetical protein
MIVVITDIAETTNANVGMGKLYLFTEIQGWDYNLSLCKMSVRVIESSRTRLRLTVIGFIKTIVQKS